MPCIEGEPLKPIGFDKIIHHKQDHRCKCPILKQVKVDLREMISYAVDKWTINKWCIDTFKQIGRVITANKVKELYDIEDMILVGTNKVKDTYTDMFRGMFYEGEGDERKVIDKYYITSNNRLYSNGEIVVECKQPEKTECEIRHAFTTHSIQGETAQHKLFIDSSRMFDSRMFYTAISRAKTIDQIFIIDDISTSQKENELTEKEKIANQKKGEKAYANMVAKKRHSY